MKGFGGLYTQVVGGQRRAQVVATDGRVGGGFDVQAVAPIDQHEDRLQSVVTIGHAAQHMQKQIDFGRCRYVVDRVHGVGMPSKYSSGHSVEDAQAMAVATGIHFRITPIAPMVDAYMNNVVLKGLAEENLQARVRGTTLMGISNQEGHLVLATGNKSELAVGYSTLYGDAVGGFAPIKDIYKTDVWALARYRNAVALERGQTPPIPERSITKEPSAELRPDQKDSDSLPDYPLLDQVLRAYVDEDHGYEALLADGFDPELVRRVISLVDKAEYKRRQYPPGTKVSVRAFGKDRRLPMTSRWNEQ